MSTVFSGVEVALLGKVWSFIPNLIYTDRNFSHFDSFFADNRRRVHWAWAPVSDLYCKYKCQVSALMETNQLQKWGVTPGVGTQDINGASHS